MMHADVRLKCRSQHGTLMENPEACVDNSSEFSAGGISQKLPGLVNTALENLSGLNISMEHVINYGGPSGKVRWLSADV